MKKALVVLPTYNESGTIEKVITEIFEQQEKANNWLIEILVVDSSSPDKTAEIVQKLQKKYSHLYLLLTKKEGLGKAYIRGFNYGLEKIQPAVYLEMDSDLQHNAKDIPKMLQKIEQGADFVIGARYIKGGSIPDDWGIHRKLFSVLGNQIVRFGFMYLKVHDWTDGYRAIKSWIVKKHLQEMEKYKGYVFQIAFLDKAIKSGANVQEVPTRFAERKKGVSKIDSAGFIIDIFKYLFQNSSFIKFVIVGGTGFLVDVILFYVFISSFKFQKALASLLSGLFSTGGNYFLNNFWSFKHKQIQGGLLTHFFKFFTFVLISLGNLAIQYFGMLLCLKFFGDYFFSLFNFSFNIALIYKVLLIFFLVIPYSYFMYNRFVWKK